MNDEIIKEILYETRDLILYYAKDDEDYKRSFALFNVGKIEKILDYITNLQQENERLKEALFKSVNNTNNSMELTEDYKYRCEKAVDKLTIKQARFINENDYVLDDNDLDEIMYILQNGSEENG